ncbi:hypothetical protein IGI04_023360 [Brassica rapa subsp. trilocularis]|uniref:Neprosin activation peptide domain-containing protein n=1 Tax=Brassica rapa subsp. trilocularis TaxID=1813537 RepID=A0ABQ7M3M9_BRACM|nr:hypothetical protein IGI04_023360 [Brassica rapa subsp. trilocularis]
MICRKVRKSCLIKNKSYIKAELMMHVRHTKMSILTGQQFDSNRSYGAGKAINCMYDSRKILIHSLPFSQRGCIVNNIMSIRYYVSTQLKQLN